MSRNQIADKVRELRQLKAMAEELQDEITTLEDDLKDMMTAQGVDEMTVDIFKLKYKTVKSMRFDAKAFREKHNDLYNLYAKQTEYKRFSVA